MDERKPLLMVIAGPNGSGKTTITSKILSHEWLEDSYYINPDNIARDVFGKKSISSIVPSKPAFLYAFFLFQQLRLQSMPHE